VRSEDQPEVNTVRLQGRLIAKSEIRYTPAGIEVFEGVLGHDGEQEEAGVTRKLQIEVQLVSFGETAHRLNAEPIGKVLTVSGFLAPRYQRGKTLIVHIKEYI